MKIRSAYLLLLSVILVQAATWPPIHGFTRDMSGLMVLESATLFFLASLQASGGFSFAVLAFAIAWRTYFILVPLSWRFAELLHFGSCELIQVLGIGTGTAPNGFRFQGELVACDPTKTASLCLLLYFVLWFFFSVFQDGCSETTQYVLSAALRLFGFGIVRWIGFAAFLSWWKPDLVSFGWQIFWGFGLLISVFPFIFCSEGLFPCERPGAEIPRNEALPMPSLGDRSHRGDITSFFWWAICAVLVIGLHLYPWFLPKVPPKILIAENHSDWEPVKIRPEDRYNPVLAENNYEGWISFMQELASVTVAVSDPMKAESYNLPTVSCSKLDKRSISLEKFDLLIVKCPTKAFEPEEKEAVIEFVKNGGTLWAIGEHTDVFFMNTWINDLLASTGLKLRSDGVCDHRGRWLVTGGFQHAAAEFGHSSGYYMWATGASLHHHPAIFPLAVSSPDTFSDRWMPTNMNFFGNLSPDNSHLYGPFILSGIMPFGKGKIIVHGDSTNFNASMLSTPGKLALIANILRSTSISGYFPIGRFSIELSFILLTCMLLGEWTSKQMFGKISGVLALLLLATVGSPLINPNPDQAAVPLTSHQPRLAVDFSLKPEIGLSFGHQQTVTAGDSFDKVLIQAQHEKIHLYSAPGPLTKTVDANPTGILLAEPTLQADLPAIQALREWLIRGGKLFILASNQVAGPARTICLALGVGESKPDNEKKIFPKLFSEGCHSLLGNEDLELVHFPVGSGSIIILENWARLDLFKQDLPKIAKIFVSILKSPL